MRIDAQNLAISGSSERDVNVVLRYNAEVGDVYINNVVATGTSVIDRVDTAETRVRVGNAISVMSYLNPLAASFYPSLLTTSSNYLAGPTPNLINISSVSGPHIQTNEIVNRLNPLAPCFEPFLMAGIDNPIFESALNPNASIFYVRNSEESERNENSIASTMDTTPLVLETGTPDVSFEIMLSDDDQESLISLADNDSMSELTEEEPNRAELSSNQVTSTALAEAVIDQESPKNVMKSLRQKNIDRIIIGSLNINSIPNKIELMGDLIRGQVDILSLIHISEPTRPY